MKKKPKKKTSKYKSGLKIENSKDISPRIQQSLLHWSYIVNNQDYESWKLEKQK